MGIEPTSSAWEAEVLPLNYTRDGVIVGFNGELSSPTADGFFRYT
jgi:hypothetical protein